MNEQEFFWYECAVEQVERRVRKTRDEDYEQERNTRRSRSRQEKSRAAA